jgi:hypothetical protein
VGKVFFFGGLHYDLNVCSQSEVAELDEVDGELIDFLRFSHLSSGTSREG